jgi:hypothetical protein
VAKGIAYYGGNGEVKNTPSVSIKSRFLTWDAIDKRMSVTQKNGLTPTDTSLG